ncbi:MAG: CAP domain-containing protein, partial [Bacillota bacterium]|nr:CAP domain-containing protein [Bacillota bacterium]
VGVLIQNDCTDDTLPGTGDTDSSTPEEQPPVTSPDDDTEASEGEVHPYVLRIVELVNEERAKAGLNPVTLDMAAATAAKVRAQEIVSSFSHTRPNGSSFATALKEQGVSYRTAGENIAWGQRSPEAVMEGWMNSSGHRANILKESFTHIGVGYYQENGVNYWTQLFWG